MESGGLGAVLGYFFGMVILFIVSLLISKEMLPESQMEILVLAASLLGGCFGGFIGARRYGARFLPVGLLTGGIMVVIRVLCSCANPNGEPFGALALKIYSFMLLGSMLGGVLSKRKKKRKR